MSRVSIFVFFTRTNTTTKTVFKMGDFSKKALCQTMLHAAITGNPVALQGALAQGADINICNTMVAQADRDTTARSDATHYSTEIAGRPGWTRQTGPEKVKEITVKDSTVHGMSLLNKAVFGVVDICKKHDLDPRMKTIALLSSLGINKPTGIYHKWTPLHVASSICQPELILLLLSMGADPTIKSETGQTGPEMVPEYCHEGLEAYRFYYFNAPEKPKKK